MSASRLVRSTDLHVSMSHLELTWSFVSCCHSWHGSHSFHLEPCDLDLREWKCLWWLSKLVFVQTLSRVWVFATPWTGVHQALLSSTKPLPKFMSIKSVMLSNHLVLSRPLLLPSIFPSIKVLSNEAALWIRWPKYWSFSFSIHPSNEYSGLISLRIDWFEDSKGLSRVFSSTSVWKHQFFALSLLYGPTLTSIHDYWKNRSFDWPDLCQQSDVSAF